MARDRTAEEAWRWYYDQPWMVGANRLPACAVNAIEIWQADPSGTNTLEVAIDPSTDEGRFFVVVTAN